MRATLDILHVLLVAILMCFAAHRLTLLRTGYTFEGRRTWALEAIAFAFVALCIAVIQNIWNRI